MARIHDSHDDYRHGTLLIEPQSLTECIHVYYIPPQVKLEKSGLPDDEVSSYRVKLLELDINTRRVTIFPTNTLGGHADFLKPKYSQIERITLADCKPALFALDDDPWPPQSTDGILEILEGLPSGFTKDYDYGLGVAKEYEFIINAVEELTDCEEIVISRGRQTGVNQEEKIFVISTDDFETMRKSLNSRTSLSRAAARSVKTTETYNFLAAKIGQDLIPLKLGRHRLRKLFTRVIQNNVEVLSDDDQEEVLGILSKNVKSLAEEKPGKLAKLRNDIELVNLELLISRYETMMTLRHKEADWQKFLNENPFILGLAFGYPIVVVQEQASVGGRKLSARGEKLADFLVKNSMTNNTALIEIKTPQSKLLHKTPFRDGVFTPSSELSGSTSQVLDQKYQFQREISLIMDKSKIFDIPLMHMAPVRSTCCR